MPANPGAWITTTARNRAIDRLRRGRRLRDKTEELARDAVIEAELVAIEPEPGEGAMEIPDDRLRLIFTCCHPALPLDGRVALTLRTLGGLTTPYVRKGTAAKHEAVLREDYVGDELVQTDDTGRPVMSIVTTRDNGQDVRVFAPAARINVRSMTDG